MTETIDTKIPLNMRENGTLYFTKKQDGDLVSGLRVLGIDLKVKENSGWEHFILRVGMDLYHGDRIQDYIEIRKREIKKLSLSKSKYCF